MEKMIIALYSPIVFNSLLEMVHNLISLDLFLSFCQNISKLQYKCRQFKIYPPSEKISSSEQDFFSQYVQKTVGTVIVMEEDRSIIFYLTFSSTK